MCVLGFGKALKAPGKESGVLESLAGEQEEWRKGRHRNEGIE